MADRFSSFIDLARHKREGVDYRIHTRTGKNPRIAIVAPHGGQIEWHTDDIADKIAGDDYAFYCFEGLETVDAFEQLHITSTLFDEPRCLEMVGNSEVTITIHGCMDDDPAVYIGGLDTCLKSKLARAFSGAGIRAEVSGHRFPATSTDNICNKNMRGQGVQLEFTRGLRNDAILRARAVEVLRHCLL